MRINLTKVAAKNRKISERGQAIVLIVFSIIGVIGMTALAVDGGRIFLERRSVQNAADSTAMGAALARVRDPQGKWVMQAYAVAKQNGYDNNGGNNSVTIYSPPVSGKYAGDIEYIQVIVSSRIRLYFGAVIGVRTSTVVAETVSRTKAPELTQLLDGNAIVSLRPTSECGNVHDMSFWVRGESTLSVTGSGIFINSNNPDCALMQSGSGSIRLKDESAEIKVVGGVDVQKPQLITPFPPTINSAPISYPPPFFMPQLGCHKMAEVSPDGLSMTAGTWSSPDPFPPTGVMYLGPGVYCIIDTNFVTNGDIEGKDVIFKVEGGKVHISGNADISLSAPDSGDLAGLLFYLPMDNHKPFVINGGANSIFRGTILAPGAEVHINGNASQFGFHSQFIGYSIHSDGTSDVKITYTDEENYDAYTMPEIYLIK
jgi:hypothetical protein